MSTIVSDLKLQVVSLFNYVTDTALAAALGADLPFIGDAFGAVAQGGMPLLQGLESDILSELDELDDLASAESIAAKLEAMDFVTASYLDDVVTFHIGASDMFSATTSNFELAVGGDLLGFTVGGHAAVNLGYTLDISLAYDTLNHMLKTAVASGDEIKLHLGGAIEVNGSGQLGFLGVTMVDNYAADELSFNFGLNIDNDKKISDLTVDSVQTMVDGNAHLDLLLKTSLGTDLLPTISTDLVVNYDILTHDAGDGAVGIGMTPSIELQAIKLDLGGFVDFLASVFGPVITEIFGTFPVGPLLDVVTAPLPIINDALQALHLAHDLDVVGGDDLINLLDIAVIGGADAEILNNFAIAFSLIKGIIKAGEDNGSAAPFIDLGSITLAGTPATDASQSKSGSDNLGELPVPVFNMLDHNPLDNAMSELKKELEDKPDGTAGLGGILKPLIDVLTTVGIDIPLLSAPEKLLPFLFGGPDIAPVKLIEYKIPTLYFEAGYSQFFPIVGPIGLSFGGMFHAGIDVSFGYDTLGIQHDSFADGFYLTTAELMNPLDIGDGIFVNYAPAATLGVGIAAAAAVNVGFAEIAVGGGLSADLAVYFPGADVQGDGKLRLGDIAECLFDPLHGEFTAQIFIKFTIGFGPFSFTHRFDIADILLAEFNFGCDAPTSEEGHGLASLINGNQLQLNAGFNAENLVINMMEGKDKGELFEIRNAYDTMGNKLENVLDISAFTLNEHYSGLAGSKVDFITATMGIGHDVVVIAEDVLVSAHISGGDDDDLLVGGGGGDILAGDGGFDHLIGGKGNDHLFGGDGDDLIEGGEGADEIVGGDDYDQVSYEHSTAGVIFTRDKADHSKFIGKGGEADGDTVSEIEYLIGSHFNDQLFGNPDDDNTIEGLDGNDVLIGGGDEDYLIGGAGSDALFGGGSDTEDGTSYLTSSAGVVVDLVKGKGVGGDADGDSYKSIEDVQGSFADDTIIGNGEDNVIDGWYGDDKLSGGVGNDEIDGGDGNDIVFASGDSEEDKLGGGGMVSNKGHDLLTYERVSHGVTVDLLDNSGVDRYARTIVSTGETPDEDDDIVVDTLSTFENLTGTNFEDTLTGDIGYNVINGMNGFDTIKGEAGNDTLIGGGGADLLDGGTGIDLADYIGSTGSVTVNLTINSSNLGAEAAGDQLIRIENLRGSDFSDVLIGDSGSNEIDAALSHFGVADLVYGGNGNDVLVLDYSRGDKGKGVIGGFAMGLNDSGSFVREELNSLTLRDGVTFASIERLNVTATGKNDIIFGGESHDMITTGLGDDLIFTGLGVDRVFAGSGNDIVVSGTDLSRQLSLRGGTDVFELNGGTGIDGLSISLAAYQSNVVLTGTDGLKEFAGVNAVLKNGTAISQFEVLLAVVTDRGDDKITQPGSFDNFIATGYGVDEIRAGLGADFVDGGLDYRIGTEIGEPDPSGALAPLGSIDSIYANAGDLLVLDYSGLDTQVLGGVATANTTSTMLVGNASVQIQTNNGQYTSGANTTSFVNIERLDVTGSSANDLLVGTSLLLGRNVGAEGSIVASKGDRGDDRLAGGMGNDLLIGNTGDDQLFGDAGDDVLLGAAVGSGRDAIVDRGEIDTLVGGTGSDTFILGTVSTAGNTIVYYNDGVVTNSPDKFDRTASGSNRAIVADFNVNQDHLQLGGVLSDYRSELVNGSTRIFLRDGLDGNGVNFAKNDELIGELSGVKEFNLNSAYVQFVGGSVLDGSGRSNVMSAASASIVDRLNSADAPVSARFEIDVPSVNDMLVADITPPVLAGPVVFGPWVTQTNDVEELRAVLFDGETGLSQGELTLEGDASAFGVFSGDPFGLGHGIVISTGAVVDLAGKNLIDGGLKLAKSADLVFVAVGNIGGDTLYRADLSGLGFDLNSLKLTDKSNFMGGSGGTASGFDINSIALSHTKLVTVDNMTKINLPFVLPKIDAFSFDAANVEFTPGTQREGSGFFTNGPDLEGSINGLIDFAGVGLGTLDDGFLSLGDGGSLGFDLNQTVSTSDDPLYLYVTEKGANGEMLSTGFTASSDRLHTPTDLSTDLGAPGVEGDSIALIYKFTPFGNKDVPDLSITNVSFDFVFFSEELVEYVQTEFNDNFKITLNGVNLALLSGGSAASIDTLYAPAAGGSASSSIFSLRTDDQVSDFIYNPVATGPQAAQTRADGYSKVLHFSGAIIAGGENILRVEVNDIRDGLLDSGILIRGGSFLGQSTNTFFTNTADSVVQEGENRLVSFGLTVPTGGVAHGPLTVTFHATEGLDLGAGAGQDVVRTLGLNGQLTDSLFATPVVDGDSDGTRFEIITVEVSGADAPLSVAPLIFEVDDSLISQSHTVGDAPERYSRAEPRAWADAWNAAGMHITHTADSTGRAPVYSAVDFGTSNPGLLTGSDMLAGDLGVSGQARGTPGVAQEISGKEALRFMFDSGDVSGFSIDFNRFEAGDTARIELRDVAGTIIRTETARTSTFEVHDLHGIAAITIGAATGAFVLDSLSVTENVHAARAVAFEPSRDLHFAPAFVGMGVPMMHMEVAAYQIA